PRSRQLDFVLQIRATGQIGWAVPLGTGPSLRDVAVAPDGTVYVLSETRIIIFDRNGSRLAEATIPKPADKRVYTSFELAADPRACLDAFMAKADANGQIVYATYFGGSGDDAATRIAVDAAGGVIIGGSTTSADLPVANAVQPRCQPASATACNDMFVARFDASGRSVTFSTFLGGGGTAMLQSIAADAYGKIVVAATVSGSDLPIRRGGQPANGAG